MQLDRALYGSAQSALLWYELYSNTLKGMGFELNPYDLCVANANIKASNVLFAKHTPVEPLSSWMS